MTAQTRTDLTTQINADVADNTTGDISAEDVRVGMIDSIDSAVFPEDEANVVIIQSASDFPAPVSGVITLDTGVVYRINGAINIGTDRIAVNGASLIEGYALARDSITYTGVGTMFTATLGDNIRIKEATVSCPNGTLLDTNGDGTGNTVLLERVGFDDILACGNVEDTIFFNVDKCFVQNVTTGFTFSGSTNQRFIIRGSTILNTTNIMFALGTAVFQNLSINNNQAIVTPLGGTFLSGAVSSANVGIRGVLNNNIFSGAGDALSGITVQDLRWNSETNFGLDETETDAFIYISTPAETVISTISVPVVVAGTYTEIEADNFTTDANGRITYIGLDEVKITVNAIVNAEMASGGAKTAAFCLGKNGTAVLTTSIENTLSNGALSVSSFQAILSLVTGDYLEAMVSNESDTTNIQANKLTIIVE